MVVSLCEVVPQALVSGLLDVEREFGVPGLDDVFEIVSVVVLQMAEVNDG